MNIEAIKIHSIIRARKSNRSNRFVVLRKFEENLSTIVLNIEYFILEQHTTIVLIINQDV